MTSPDLNKHKIQLLCPIDKKLLTKQDKQYVCENGHSFDIARQGYVNLLPVQQKRSMNPGDSKDMVNARSHFLNSGVYNKVALNLAEILRQHISESNELKVLDAGCGEGYYLNFLYNYFLQQIPNNNFSYLGLDISKLAIVAAARRNKNISWVVGTNRSPPVEGNSIDVILCVFGFQSYNGFNQVLKGGGKVILVEPAKNHLKELREIIYNDVKLTEPTALDDAEQEGFKLIETIDVNFETDVLNHEAVQQLLLMTPHFFRANQEGRERASEIKSLSLTIDMVIRVLEKEMDSR